MILAAIVTVEIAFWVFVGLGLLLRHPLGRPRAGLVLFALTPVVDLVLLGLVVLDLRAGGSPGFTHGLAAFYIGFSVMFGHRMIRWADRQYRVRVRREEVPVAVSAHPVRDEWVDFARATVAVALAVAALELVIRLAGVPQAAQLRQLWGSGAMILLVWLLTGPVWQLARLTTSPTRGRG